MKTLVAIGLLFLIASCAKPNLERLDFFTVKKFSLEVRQLGLVELEANVEMLSAGAQVEACGFLCTTKPDEIFGDKPTAPICQNADRPVGNGSFEGSVTISQQNQTWYFRAFARQGERTVYSEEVRNYTLGDLVLLNSKTVVKNDTAILLGQLVGLEAIKASVIQHGHVISPTDTNPTLGCSGCLPPSKLGSSNNDVPFESRFEHLNFNTTYHARAYVITATDTFYSTLSGSFRVGGGWRKQPDFQPFQEGIGIAGGTQALVGFGCQKTAGCLPGEHPSDFWLFDGGQWMSAPLPTNVERTTNTAAFSLGGKMYVQGGHYPKDVLGQLGIIVTRDFWQYDPAGAGSWKQKTSPPFPDRSGAVAFTIGDFAYVGTGVNSYPIDPNQPVAQLFDFWQYNPQTEAWRRVADLPLKLSPGTAEQYAGRAEAIAFAATGKGYVGGGIAGNTNASGTVGTNLSDFWQFTPPTTTNPQDSGKWEYVGQLPGTARSEAVGFSIGEKGYFGMGINTGDGIYNDFYEFDPASKTWKKTTPFPGEKRKRAVVFELNERGYLLGGVLRAPAPSHLVIEEKVLADFWEYIPEQ